MRYEVTAEYSAKLVKTVTRRFLWRHFGWIYLVLCLLLLACLIVLVCIGGRGWFVGAIGATLFIAIVGAVSVSVNYRRRALDVLRKMEVPKVTFIVEDDGIAVTSELSSGKLKWNAIQKIWCFPEAWLLFVAKGMYMTLPTDCLTDELRQFVIERLKEHGIGV